MEVLNEILNSVLYAVIITVVPMGVKALFDYLKALKNEKIALVKNENLRAALDELYISTSKAVHATSQVYVDSLKKAGKFDEDSQQEALKKAKDRLLELLSTESKELLQSSFEYFNNMVDSLIESEINEINSTKKE